MRLVDFTFNLATFVRSGKLNLMPFAPSVPPEFATVGFTNFGFEFRSQKPILFKRLKVLFHVLVTNFIGLLVGFPLHALIFQRFDVPDQAIIKGT